MAVVRPLGHRALRRYRNDFRRLVLDDVRVELAQIRRESATLRLASLATARRLTSSTAASRQRRVVAISLLLLRRLKKNATFFDRSKNVAFPTLRFNRSFRNVLFYNALQHRSVKKSPTLSPLRSDCNASSAKRFRESTRRCARSLNPTLNYI